MNPQFKKVQDQVNAFVRSPGAMNPLRSSLYFLGGLGIVALLMKTSSSRMKSSISEDQKEQLSPDDLKELHYRTPDLSSDPSGVYSSNPSPS